jgi:hypothetical protein
LWGAVAHLTTGLNLAINKQKIIYEKQNDHRIGRSALRGRIAGADEQRGAKHFAGRDCHG